MLSELDIEKSIDEVREHRIDFLPLFEFIIETRTLSKYAVCRATGMSYVEIESFLNNKRIYHSGDRIDYGALTELKDWYLKKMRRYVRNALAQKLELGIKEATLFLDFCITYRKFGHYDVSSWDDIDEHRLLQDFEAKCLETLSSQDYKYVYINSLMNWIYRSFLFHLRLKKAPKHRAQQTNTYLSFILCNRYHIFTGEADSHAFDTFVKANAPYRQRLNLPRSTALYALAS